LNLNTEENRISRLLTRALILESNIRDVIEHRTQPIWRLIQMQARLSLFQGYIQKVTAQG
jgi:hypothetical protein